MSKSIDLGKVIKGKKGPYFSFDPSIKSIKITREYTQGGNLVKQEVEVPLNDKGYLESAFISKTEEYFKNKADRGWMKPDQAESSCKKLLEGGVSSIFQVKVK